jgi:hypothetical protein
MEDALAGPSPDLRSTSPAEAGEVRATSSPTPAWERVGAAGEGGGDCDVIGLGRPLCWQPDFPRRLLARETDAIENLDARLRLRDRGWLSPTSPYTAARALNAFGAQAWYYCQIFRLAAGRPADLNLGVFGALGEYLFDELRAARRMHGAYRKGSGEQAS